MRISIDILGADRIEREFVRIGDKATDLSAGFERALDLIGAAVERQFATQGAPSGGWQPLAESTVRQKGHARILERSGTLRREATSGAQRTVGAEEASYAVSGGAPYWVFHHSKAGRSHLPRRPLLEVDETLRRGIMRELQRDLFGDRAGADGGVGGLRRTGAVR